MNILRAKLQAENTKIANELQAKKEKLFLIKDPAQWELDEDKARQIPRNQLLEDKTLAFELMLVKVIIFIQ